MFLLGENPGGHISFQGCCGLFSVVRNVAPSERRQIAGRGCNSLLKLLLFSFSDNCIMVAGYWALVAMVREGVGWGGVGAGGMPDSVMELIAVTQCSQKRNWREHLNGWKAVNCTRSLSK